MTGKFFAEHVLRLVCVIAITLATIHTAEAQDVRGSKDSPLLSRFKGSTIAAYQHADYDELVLPTGAVDGSQFASTLPAKGEVTRLVYATPKGKGGAEVLANYRAALAAGGFRQAFACTTDTPSCGGMTFAQKLAQPLLDKVPDRRNEVINLLYANNDDVRYTLMSRDKDGQQAQVAVMVASNQGEPVGVLVTIVQSGAMPGNEVTLDSAAMRKGLDADGKIALYGLHFANDSAKLTPDSSKTLEQMAALLKQAPAMKVYIVGHTDNTGAPAHNATLSQQRADAVVAALATTYGIAPARMKAEGLAAYSPVASNHAEAGKAKNRRVELVEQ
jgi:OOP family OmpA-OmpF porin